jgi:hypothetical protein
MAPAGTRIHKVIITGTGRAGTTFLVRLLTELGLDTGYTRDTWREAYNSHCQAGLEHDLADPKSPYIVKNPGLCLELAVILAQGRIVIDHALVPVRDLESAARSRIRVGGGGGAVPGGMVHTDDPSQQKGALAEAFHGLIHTLAVYDIPHTLLHFPRFAQEPDYALAKLRFLLGDLSRERFHAAFARVAEPALIHDFSQDRGVGATDPSLARAYYTQKRSRRRLRLRRRLGQLAAASVITALLLLIHWPNRVNAFTNSSRRFGLGHLRPVPNAVAPRPSVYLPELESVQPANPAPAFATTLFTVDPAPAFIPLAASPSGSSRPFVWQLSGVGQVDRRAGKKLM